MSFIALAFFRAWLAARGLSMSALDVGEQFPIATIAADARLTACY